MTLTTHWQVLLTLSEVVTASKYKTVQIVIASWFAGKFAYKTLMVCFFCHCDI